VGKQLKDAAAQLKQTLDRIATIKNNPEQVQQIIAEAKQKVDQLVHDAEQP
jgi:vacuolar-type H+-ATPase subunit H